MNKLKKIGIQLAGLGLAGCICMGLQAQASFQLVELGQDQFILKVLSEQVSKQAPREQLQVFIHQEALNDPPPIYGQYQLEKHSLTFSPILAFKRQQAYVAIFQERDTFHFSLPEKKGEVKPQLTGIYPSADSMPENLLKFYLYFDQPMAEGQAYSKVLIEKKDGSPVEKPFLELQPELWNEDQTRLTLWLDPGRVKRDLGPNQLMGPPLTAGHTYRLRIDPDWESREGVKLDRVSGKTFHTYASDRQSPDPQQWKIKAPLVESAEPLSVQFEEPLDYALLLHTIQVLDEEKNDLQGKIEIGDHEKSWSFLPDLPWKAGKYHIRIEAKLEDLAANNLNRPFDRDLSTTELREQEFYWISFEIRDLK